MKNTKDRGKLFIAASGLIFCLAQPALAIPGNLLQNPGFESGSLTPGWTKTGTVGVSGANAHSGNDAANLGSVIGVLQQTVATSIGTTYQFSYWVASDATPNNAITGNAAFSATVGGTLLTGSVITEGRNSAARPYQLFSFSYTATAATTTILFSDARGSGNFHVDDVYFGTPEIDAAHGAAPLGLALGSLLLAGDARRRKRIA